MTFSVCPKQMREAEHLGKSAPATDPYTIVKQWVNLELLKTWIGLSRGERNPYSIMLRPELPNGWNIGITDKAAQTMALQQVVEELKSVGFQARYVEIPDYPGDGPKGYEFIEITWHAA